MESSGNLSKGASGLGAAGPPSTGIGNYKGVMLCNRPFAGTGANNTAAAAATGAAGRSNFSCGLVPEALGINVAISSKDKFKLKRPKKETVLTKHKKWLADLQKTKDKLEIQYIEEMQRKEEQAMRFQEQEKKMRNAAREMLHEGDSKSNAGRPETLSPTSSAASSAARLPPMPPLYSNNNNSSSSGGGGGGAPAIAGAKSIRPAWAMTEKAAETSDEKELLDEEGLIDFAKGLDFDKFIDDIEVQTMMKKLKERISLLEREVKNDDLREMDAEERAARREMLALMGSTASSLGEEGKKVEEGDAVYAAAKAVLEGDEDMQGVHSKLSVAAMLRSAKEKIASISSSVAQVKSNNEAVVGGGEAKEIKVSNMPMIVVHEPSEGTRIEGKNTVSNLPYIHRNPAV